MVQPFQLKVVSQMEELPFEQEQDQYDAEQGDRENKCSLSKYADKQGSCIHDRI